jgi:hypothetical protein
MPALPSTEEEFPGHATHAAADTAVMAVLYKLTPQNVQAWEPAVALYLPATHAEHGPQSGPVYPAMQTQIVNALGEYVLASQSVHVAVPVTVLYVPSTHDEHVPPSASVYPDAH